MHGWNTKLLRREPSRDEGVDEKWQQFRRELRRCASFERVRRSVDRARSRAQDDGSARSFVPFVPREPSARDAPSRYAKPMAKLGDDFFAAALDFERVTRAGAMSNDRAIEL